MTAAPLHRRFALSLLQASWNVKRNRMGQIWRTHLFLEGMPAGFVPATGDMARTPCKKNPGAP